MAVKEEIKKQEGACNNPEHSEMILALNDTLNVISGKWKVPIIGTLMYGDAKRFNEIEREIATITSRMLSKELKELEINGIVKRTVYDSIPVRVEYELTKSGKTLDTVLIPMMEWGMKHRKAVMSK